MDIEQINHWIEEPLRVEPEEIEDRFFSSFENRRPEQITHDQLRRINIPEGRLGNELPRLVERFGIEILAYYRPFHFHRPDRGWGIYLRGVGIAHVRQRLVDIAHQEGVRIERNNQDAATAVAKDILLLHELRHHAIEIAFTRVELQTDTRDAYQRYHTRKRNRGDRTLHHNTEAICNANVANHIRTFITAWRPHHAPGPRESTTFDWNDYVSQFMIHQPAGYSDFAQFTGLNYQQIFESLQLPVENAFDLRQIKEDFKNHSDLKILRRFPVPIYFD